MGKGVTFDSGGLSLKPSDSMKTMKCDMAGAATVLGAMQAISALKLPCNVLAVCGLVENMVGPDSYRLGDVLTARNGRTIEVLNTDAEGRLVLADALDVAVERGASRLVDLATLTGACVVALGHEAAGLMTDAGRRAVEVAKANGWWTILDPVEDLIEPAELAASLARDTAARNNWNQFPPTARKAMLWWVISAARDDTRAKRIDRIVADAAQGKRAQG